MEQQKKQLDKVEKNLAKILSRLSENKAVRQAMKKLKAVVVRKLDQEIKKSMQKGTKARSMSAGSSSGKGSRHPKN